MIVETQNGWQVISEKGKPLSKDTLTEDEAKKRLRQIHAFKYAKIKGTQIKAKNLKVNK